MAEEFEPPELVETMAEVALGEREFEAEGFGRVKIRWPTQKERHQANMEYSKYFTQLLDEGLLKTRDEMEETLRKRKIWTDKHEEEKIRLRDLINDTHEAQAKARNKGERRKAIESRQKARDKLQELMVKYETLMANTVESKADEVRIGHIIYRVTSYVETDEPVWPTYDDYVNESNESGFAEVYGQWMAFQQGLPSNFLDILHEQEELLGENGEPDGEPASN